MNDSAGSSVANPVALKVVFALGGIVVLVLLGTRLVPMFGFVQAMLAHAPLVQVEPGVFGGLIIAAAIIVAPLVLLLPMTRRLTAVMILAALTLAAFALSGSLTARGGPNIDHTPVATLLHARGYARCTAADKIRGSGRATRGEYLAEGWALPGACPGDAVLPGKASYGTYP